MKEPDICRYWTFKTKENPDVYFVRDANTLIDVSTTAHKTKIDADKYIPHIIGLLLKGDEK